MEWNFRTAQLSDLDRVTEIEYICFPAKQAATRAAFEQRIKTFPSHFILLEHEGTPIGFVNGAVLDATLKTKCMSAPTAIMSEGPISPCTGWTCCRSTGAAGWLTN